MDYDRVESLQNKYGLTDVAMAKVIGVTRSQSYRDIITFKRMKVVYLEKICEYFKVDVSEFIKPVKNTEYVECNTEVVNEPSPIYNSHPCPSCVAKSETIEILKKANTDLLDRIKHLEKVIDNCLSPAKRNTGT